jgi:hypothetical protein
MPMFNVSFPSNALFFYQALKDISTFEILPSSSINGAIYDISDGETKPMPYLFS